MKPLILLHPHYIHMSLDGLSLCEINLYSLQTPFYTPNFKNARLCVTACGIMHLRCCRPEKSWVHCTTSCNTQSSSPEDGREHRPKHDELIIIINKPLLLHLFGVYIIYVNDTRLNEYQISLLHGSFVLH
jgi:hypothetical protein